MMTVKLKRLIVVLMPVSGEYKLCALITKWRKQSNKFKRKRKKQPVWTHCSDDFTPSPKHKNGKVDCCSCELMSPVFFSHEHNCYLITSVTFVCTRSLTLTLLHDLTDSVCRVCVCAVNSTTSRWRNTLASRSQKASRTRRICSWRSSQNFIVCLFCTTIETTRLRSWVYLLHCDHIDINISLSSCISLVCWYLYLNDSIKKNKKQQQH